MDCEERIREIFGPSGVLARSIPGYEHRPQQTHMALEVYQAIEAGDSLIVEAPTGTGKTLAYLVAAALSRRRVAISTGTKNLQEQLFYKDLPFVQEKIFPDLRAALLKGRGNFVCHARISRFLSQPRLQGPFDHDSIHRIVEWYPETVQQGQGDRAELEDLPDDDPLWPEICSGTDTCIGKKCADRDRCFVLRMRSRAVDSDLMIVNHHLLASDLAVKDSGFGEVIPRYEALIVDEAHGLEDAVTQHFGFHMSYFRIVRLLRDTSRELTGAGVRLEEIQGLLNSIEDVSRRLFREFQGVPSQKKGLEALDSHAAGLRHLLCRDLEALSARVAGLPEVPEDLRALARRGLQIREEIEIILADEPSGEYACWAESRDGAVTLHASPVEVGEMLLSRLYERMGSLVFTSATLSSSGNFDYFKARLGLEELAPRETILDSPFDLASQTLFYVPRSIPEPNAPDFTEALAPVLEEILERTHGRAFVLFTSYRNMQYVYGKMEGRVPFPLLLQGSRPRSRLLNDFREQVGSVLFATASFWEGVDVQGESLSCVIVDRLPFAPPDDPIVAARIERMRKQGIDPFRFFQVPMAVLALKQGLGRLIRTRSDRGVLCILDKRIITRSYGRIFRKSLQTGPICRDPAGIDAFFTGDMTSSDEPVAGPA
ncbi:MAG: ATP-dependent DNA helicase [Deltaproteobacteria bacterium]